MRTVLFFLFFQLCTALFGVSFVWAAEESMEEKAADYEEELLDDLDTRQMQRIMDELLEEDSFSFKEIVRELMENGQAITGEQALELVEEASGNCLEKIAASSDRFCCWLLRLR